MGYILDWLCSFAYRNVNVALLRRKEFFKLIALVIMILFASQTLFNLSVNIDFCDGKRLTLPFTSYGEQV